MSDGVSVNKPSACSWWAQKKPHPISSIYSTCWATGPHTNSLHYSVLHKTQRERGGKEITQGVSLSLRKLDHIRDIALHMALQPATITIILIHLQRDRFAPALVVQVSNGAVHELIGRPLQCHDISSLVQREVTWDGLHVIPLKQSHEDGCKSSMGMNIERSVCVSLKKTVLLVEKGMTWMVFVITWNKQNNSFFIFTKRRENN